jgi:hypothetical protein
MNPQTSALSDALPGDAAGAFDPLFVDPVIEAYKKDVDRTLLRGNLRLTPAERAAKFADAARFAHELREAGRRAREADPKWGLR